MKRVFSCLTTEVGGHGHDFGHESVSEPVSKADSDTRFSQTSDTDSDMGKLRNFGHGFGLGQGFGHGLRTRTRTWKISKLGHLLAVSRN